MNSVLETAITVLVLVVCAYYHASYCAGLYSTNSTFVHPNDEPEDFADKWDFVEKLAYTQKFDDEAVRNIAFKRVFNSTRSQMLYEQEREVLEREHNERLANLTATLKAEREAYYEKLKKDREQRMQEEMEFEEKRRKDDEKYRRIFNDINDMENFMYFETLGLPTGATKSEIKRAYRTLALQLHPDKVCNGQSHCKAPFLKVQEAYDRLMK